MKRCCLLANCQGHGVALYLERMGFPYTIDIFESYRFFEGVVNEVDLLNSARSCDLFLCQPTQEFKHKHRSSAFFIREVIPKTARVVQFPYVWNTGQHPLFPQVAPLYYQGFAEIRDYLASRPLADVLAEYDAGTFNFHLTERFRKCAEETRRRERDDHMDVTIADWMLENRMRRLLISYNHPTSITHYEIARRIYQVVMGRPGQCAVKHYNEPQLPSELPLSAFVVREFNIGEFPHPDAHLLYRRMLEHAHCIAHGDLSRPTVDTHPYVL